MTSQGQSSRREILTSSLKLIGASAIVATSARWSAPVAAQDEGIGAGGRQGGDDGGGGRRRRRDDAETPEGVGGGGRSTTEPTVNGMPHTGIGMTDEAAIAAGRVAPLLLVAGAVGAASMAMKTRVVPAAISSD